MEEVHHTVGRVYAKDGTFFMSRIGLKGQLLVTFELLLLLVQKTTSFYIHDVCVLNHFLFI